MNGIPLTSLSNVFFCISYLLYLISFLRMLMPVAFCLKSDPRNKEWTRLSVLVWLWLVAKRPTELLYQSLPRLDKGEKHSWADISTGRDHSAITICPGFSLNGDNFLPISWYTLCLGFKMRITLIMSIIHWCFSCC